MRLAVAAAIAALLLGSCQAAGGQTPAPTPGQLLSGPTPGPTAELGASAEPSAVAVEPTSTATLAAVGSVSPESAAPTAASPTQTPAAPSATPAPTIRPTPTEAPSFYIPHPTAPPQPTPRPTPMPTPRPTAKPKPWYPSGYSIILDDPPVAYRWLKPGEYHCAAYSSVGCWGAIFVAKGGCTNLFVTLSVVTKGGTVVGSAVGSATGMAPKQLARIIFDASNSNGGTLAKVSQVVCV